MSGLGGPEDPLRRSWESSWQQQVPQPEAQPTPAQQQQQQQPSWKQTGFQATPHSSGSATAALVLGICGIVVCPIICSIFALILGYTARSSIKASGGAIAGSGLAIWGIVLGWLGIVGWGLVFAIAIAAGPDTSTSGTLLIALF
jgi:hypothetical protein